MKHKLNEIFDIDLLKEIFKSFTDLTGNVIAILDLDGKVYVSTGWQQICTQFHRANKESKKRCVESDTVLAGKIKDGEKYIMYKCKNGLYDIAIPIVIRGAKVGNLFTGQFLTKKPDIEYFRKQAKRFGYDENQYLSSLEKVPILNLDEINQLVLFLSQMTEAIGTMGLKDLQNIEINKQLQSSEQQLRASNQQLRANEQQLRASNQQLKASDQQLRATNQQLIAANLQIAESERKYRSLYKDAPLPYQSLNEKGEFIDINDAWLRTLGYKRDEVIGKSFSDFLHSDFITHFEKNFPAFKKQGYVNDVEFKIRHNKGHYLDISFEGCITKNPDGSFKHTYCVFQDISKRKKAEDQLRKNEILLRSSVESPVNVVILSLDCNYRYLLFNKAHKNEMLIAYGKEPKVGECIFDFVTSEDDCKRLKQNYDRAFAGESIHETGMFGDMQKRYYDLYINPIIGENREIIGITAYAYDITDKKQLENELKQSEERYRELVNTVNSGVAIYKVINDGKSGKDYIIQDFNKTALKIEKMSKNQVVGKSLFDLRPNIDKYGLIDIFRNVWKTGEPAFYPAKIYVDENFSNYYENRVFRLPNGEIVAIYDDVTEKENAIAKIEESRKRFDLAMKASSDGIFDWNLETNEIYYSPAWKKMIGYEDSELPNDFSIWETTTKPEDVQNSWELQKKLINKEIDKFEIEFKMKHKEGHWVDVLSRAEAVFNEEGKAVRMIGTHLDITETKRKERLIKESEEKYRKLSDDLEAFVCTFKPDGTITYINVKLASITGMKIDALIGMNIFEFLKPDVKNFVKKRLQELNPENPTETHTQTFESKDGDIAWHKWINRGFFDEKGKLEIIQGIGIDITDQKKHETELINAKLKAEESDRLKTAFLSNMSHEIRTPMNGILGFTSLLKEPKLTGQEKEKYINIIEQSGERMLTTINDIIDISRIEAGLVETVISDVDLLEIINELYNFFKLEASSKGLKLINNSKIDNEEVLVRTDKNKLECILSNLIKNAIKFTAKGSITLSLSIIEKDANKLLKFVVKDTGIGIPKERLKAIFNRFEQADIEDKKVFEGSGLGLAITKSYVEMLGGEICVKSEQNSGSEFIFTIPYEINKLTKGKAQKQNLNQNLDSFSNLSVLVAEDDEISILLFETLFENVFKELSFVRNGQEVIEMCKKMPDIDLILMDIKMPDINGYVATQEIRNFNKDVIIIAQTAHGLNGDREKALEVGCNEYISKPFNKNELYEKIKVSLKMRNCFN